MAERKQNALNEFKLKLTAAPQENAIVRYDRAQEPTMALSVHDNQPSLTVYTNIKDDKDNGRITGDLDSMTYSAILEAIKRIANNPEESSAHFQCLGYFYPGGKRSDTMGVKATVIVGRNAKGQVYIALVAKNRPAIQFAFTPSGNHKLCGADGQVLSDAKVSELYALAYANLMSNLFVGVLQSEFVSYEEIKARKEANKQNRGGGNGGGYNRQEQSSSDKSNYDGDVHMW